MTRKLTQGQKALTVLQYDALKLTSQPGGDLLSTCDKRTITSLKKRGMLDRKGTDGPFTTTPFGRTVMVYYERHMGTAKR
jgi:hypothetical protein